MFSVCLLLLVAATCIYIAFMAILTIGAGIYGFITGIRDAIKEPHPFEITDFN